MAADTTGNKALDCIRLTVIAEAINLSSDLLENKVIISKIFMGEDFNEVKNLAKSTFKNVNFYKPASSRSSQKNLFTLFNFKDFLNFKNCL